MKGQLRDTQTSRYANQWNGKPLTAQLLLVPHNAGTEQYFV
jgi:hypothetical protein